MCYPLLNSSPKNIIGLRALAGRITKAARKVAADHWIWDGVHTMPAGHELIAREWIKAVDKRFRIL
jgi:lysophospholipase L1-like esterase